VRRRGITAAAVGLAAVLATCLIPDTRPVRAQYLRIEEILVLPVLAESGDEALATEIHEALLSGISVPPGKHITERTRLETIMSDRRLSDVVEDASGLSELAGSTGVAFVVATVLRRPSGGGFELSSVSFSREEKEVLNCVAFRFASEAELRAGLDELAGELSKAGNYSSSDSALFLSLVVPGLGQVLKEKPLHGLLSVALFGGALAYALTIPRADRFTFDRDKYTTQFVWNEQQWHYLVYGSDVGAAAFFAAADEDWEHHLQAAAARRLEEVRRRRATGLVVAAYLFNLVDTLVLTSAELDTRPFFVGLEAIPDSGPFPGSPVLRIGFGLRFRD